MKDVFTLLFSFYIIALACSPCCDVHACENKDSKQFVVESPMQSDHHHASENCSPFCICACCGQSCTAPLANSTLNFSFHSKLQELNLYRIGFVSEISFTIWQPPKIC